MSIGGNGRNKIDQGRVNEIMKVVVTGAGGQLGVDLVSILRQKHEVFGLNRHQLDVANNDECDRVITSIQPDVIIHCAAYTAVDLAETRTDQAYLVNGIGTRNIAAVADKVGARVCYISTDYVFDGTNTIPYKEYDQTNPLSVYGKSKRDGEQFVQALCSKYYIVRTSWMFGLHGNNFVKTMLELSNDNQSIRVVDDQYGSPTYTLDLSYFVLELIASEKYGIYHATNSGHCSRYEFATAIFEEYGKLPRLESCATSDLPGIAPRPRYSVLDNTSIRINGFNQLRHWREALSDFIKELKVKS